MKHLKINNKTSLYFSISSNPGSSGSKLHNSFFKLKKKNAIYLPLKIKNLKNFVDFAKDANVKGFSVSMPFKEKIIKYLDFKDSNVKKILSCNTVLNKNGKFRGYNTDYLAILDILKREIKIKKLKVLILGNGAVTKTVIFALKNLNQKNFLICARRKKNISNSKFLNFRKINSLKPDILINTTPIGMNISQKDKLNINKNFFKNLSLIIDFPISKIGTPYFQDICKKKNIKYISGKKISLSQGKYQIKLYNNASI